LKSGERLKLVTLTIPNAEHLSSQSLDLIRSFRRLRQRRFWRNHVSGGAFVLEVAGKPGNWHLHLHIICASTYLSHKKLSSEWSKCSPGHIVHVTNISSDSAIRYVTKYISKTELPHDVARECSLQLKNVRLFNVFGRWHALSLLVKKILFTCPDCGNTYFLPVHEPLYSFFKLKKAMPL
jgi:hypothetical protein